MMKSIAVTPGICTKHKAIIHTIQMVTDQIVILHPKIYCVYNIEFLYMSTAAKLAFNYIQCPKCIRRSNDNFVHFKSILHVSLKVTLSIDYTIPFPKLLSS